MPKQSTKKLVKNKAGRPTKYYPEIINKIDEYFTTVGREQTELPTVEGLAEYLGITRETIYQWSKIHPIFSDTLKRLADKQRIQLMNDGMYGGKEVNAAMSIFLLKALHGYKDGPDIAVQVNVQPILGGKSKNVIQGNESNKENTKA